VTLGDIFNARQATGSTVTRGPHGFEAQTRLWIAVADVEKWLASQGKEVRYGVMDKRR
jgi:hypothetical protein